MGRRAHRTPRRGSRSCSDNRGGRHGPRGDALPRYGPARRQWRAGRRYRPGGGGRRCSSWPGTGLPLGIASPEILANLPSTISVSRESGFNYAAILPPPFFYSSAISIAFYSRVSFYCLHYFSRSNSYFLSLAILVHFLSRISLSSEIGVLVFFK